MPERNPTASLPSADAQGQPALPERKVSVYWAPASGYQLANFQREIKEGNSIIQPERSLAFTNHVKATSDLAEIRFIEDSNAFKAGVIRKCSDVSEAGRLTAELRTARSIRTITCEDTSREDLVEKG